MMQEFFPTHLVSGLMPFVLITSFSSMSSKSQHLLIESY